MEPTGRAIARLEKRVAALLADAPTPEARRILLERLDEIYLRSMKACEVRDGPHVKPGEWTYDAGTAVRVLELEAKITGVLREASVRPEDLEKLTEAELGELVRGDVPPRLKLA